MRTYSPTQCWK